MTIRDLLNNKGATGSNAYEAPRENRQEGYLHRFVGQLLIASLLFAGVIYCYDQDTKLGQGVRFVVAMATAEDEDLLAVSGEIFPDAPVTAKTGTVSQPSDAAPAGVADSTGRLIMILPTSGVMERGFGEISEDGTVSYDGIDIRCQYEEQIKASAPGQVVSVETGQQGAANQVSIVVKHSNQLESRYLGLDEAAVAVGDQVRQGQVMGKIKEGVLHFAVYENDVAVDPFLFLNGPQA